MSARARFTDYVTQHDQKSEKGQIEYVLLTVHKVWRYLDTNMGTTSHVATGLRVETSSPNNWVTTIATALQ